MDEIIGKTIGIYEVQYLCNYKSNDGHKMYHVKCTKCNLEMDREKRHIYMTEYCKHTNITGDYVDYTICFDNHRIGRILTGMRMRCYNTNDSAYARYGARGIKVYDEWLKNPLSFENWAMNSGYQDNLTIDRIDINKDYCPENCRWVTLEENSKYKSSTSLINVDGETHTGRDWSKILNFGPDLINKYVRKYGINNVVEFIRRFKNNPNLQLKHNQSYYNAYMEQ